MFRLLLFTIALAAASPMTATAATFYATMSGLSEVPPNASPATGQSLIDVTGDTMTVQIDWSGLTGGNPSAAHIHCCTAPGTNVGVAVGFPSFPAATSGSYLHVFNLLDPTIYTSNFLNNFGGGTAAGAEAALLAGFNAGTAYTNIHNTTFPGGEIRGQVAPVPEPMTTALTALGLSLLFVRLRRR